MREIQGKARTIRELLSGRKYSIDYYQREYRWQEKQVKELIDDLTAKFLESHEVGNERSAVENYGHYFLGSIIVSSRDRASFIVDGQQRLTTLTLLLIFLNNLQSTLTSGDTVAVVDLILSKKYGRTSFNIDVEERVDCMNALVEEKSIDTNGGPESVQNIVDRYETIREHFPDNLSNATLPFFIDWLVENVHLVEITAFSDDDAYVIFETMNDRGLSLTQTEMLKGYVLANIQDGQDRNSANNLWKARIRQLTEHGKDTDGDCIKSWLRSQYANTIRETKKGATPQDFERIGTEFHRWVSDNKRSIGLDGSTTYTAFIARDFDFYARQYDRLMIFSQTLTEGFEPVFYNAQHGFTTQYYLILAPIQSTDREEQIDTKIRLVSTYLDILLYRRLWNFRTISYSTMRNAMFSLMLEIRGKDPDELSRFLIGKLEEQEESFDTNQRLRLHQQNRRFIHRLLARLTDYVERESGLDSRYVEYTTGKGKKKFEVEHVWANKPRRHSHEFDNESEFAEYRNRIGGLLLLPKSFNASYGDWKYERKLKHYFGQNLLAKSLNPDCYTGNPGFMKFVRESGLPFRHHAEFWKTELDARQVLYAKIAETVWDPNRLSDIVST